MSGLRRRELLARAAAGGGALALGGALEPSAAHADANPAIAQLESLVKLEYSAAGVYDLLARAPADAATRRLMATLAQHERDHAAVLLNAAEYIGGPPQRPPTEAQLQRAAPAVARARSRRDVLAIAILVERFQLRAYYAAQGQFDDAKLLQQTAMIMCSDAQHSALIRAAMGTDPIPSPFEVGVT